MGRDPLFVQTRIPFTNRDYVPSLIKLSQWSLRFGNRQMNAFLLFRYHYPMEKGMTFYLNKLESPTPKDALCQVWLK